MRIAMIGGYRGLPSGRAGSAGGETYQEQLATRLAARGHQVVAYNRTSYCPRSFGPECSGVALRYLPAAPFRSLAMLSHSLLAACDIALCNTADLVQVHGLGASLWLPVLRAAGKRSVVLVGGSVDWERPGRGPVARSVLLLSARAARRWADGLYVDNRSALATLESALGRPLRYIPTGAEIWAEPGTELLGACGLEAGRYVFHASQLTAAKGVGTLVEAFKQVRTQARLVLSGGGHPRSASGSDWCSADPRIVVTGHVSGRLRQQLYSHAAVYAHPSLAEGTSPSLLAAMGCGVCPVVSDIAANLEVIGDAGIPFRAGDAGDLRDKLQLVLDQPVMATEIGTRAAARARALFDWEHVVDDFETLCRSVMAE